MSQEVFQTSACAPLKGALPNTRTVAASAGLSPSITRLLQPLGIYRDPFPPSIEITRPVSWSHWSLPGGSHSVLSRVGLIDKEASDLKINGREPQAFAHHLVLEPVERSTGGPAWVMAQPGLMESDASSSLGESKRGRAIPTGDRQPTRCAAWEGVTGDAGWAGVLAATAATNPPRVAYLLFDPSAGYDVLSMLAEALALLPPARRWTVTFSTLFSDAPPSGFSCHWRCCIAGTPAAKEARRHATSGVVLDLTRPFGSPSIDDPLIQLARTGKSPTLGTEEGLTLNASTDASIVTGTAAALAEVATAESSGRLSSQREGYVDFRRNELHADLARRRPFRDWIILSALCLSLAAAVSGRKVLEAVWTDKTGITFCIAAVFLIAFSKSMSDALFIDREFRLTDEQNHLLWATNNIKLFLAKANPSIFRTHVANLATIYRRDDKIEQDNLVELMHARLRARVRPLDVASSVMVSLGLVGTIVGLIGSVGGLGTAMTHAGTDQTGLMSGMNTTLNGMGTAFSATLMGAIFGGVILRLIYTSVSGQTEYLVAHIAEITEVHLLPVLRDAARERRSASDARRAKSPAGEEGVMNANGSTGSDPMAA